MVKKENFRVDFHTHIIPDNFPDLAEKYGDNRFPILKHTCSCGAEIYKDGKLFRKVGENAWDPERRIAEMDAEGINLQVLSPIPVTFTYWADGEKCLELSKVQNNFISSVIAQYPDRFVGLGTVPLQDADLAIAEMERAVNELGLTGIEIGSNANGKSLDDPEIQRFLEAAAKMDIPIFVHPWATVGVERMPNYQFMYSIGMPSETALAAGSFIFSGILDKYPNFKICFAHGGGSLPYLLPRIDQAWEVWPHIRTTAQPPSYYSKKLYYDTLVYDPHNLQYMLKKLGADHMIMGTDYPFLLREAPPGKVVEVLEKVSDEEKRQMLGENAIRFLGLNKANIIKETV